MFCKKCGARIPDERTRFCPTCGEPVIREKPGPSRAEKGLWIVIGIIILLAAFVLLRNQPHSDRVKKISTPKINEIATPSAAKPEVPFQREVSPPPPAPAASVTPGQTPSSQLYTELLRALKGSRSTIDIRYINQRKVFRVSVSVLYDNQPRDTYLNLFSKFFATCYGEQSRPLAVATISLIQSDGTRLMSMGIGRKVAETVPASTWRQFSGMGANLMIWVKNHETNNPSSPEMACFFNQNAKF